MQSFCIPEVMIGHQSAMDITPAKYPFQRTDIRTYNIPMHSYGDTLEDIWQGEVPSKLIVGFVKSESYSGSFKSNPLWFEHFDLESMGLYVNGEPTPRQPYNFDFEDCGYLTGLLSLYRVSGKLNENTDIGISREEYRTAYSLVAFDVDPTASSDFRYLGMPKKGHTRLNIKFKTDLPQPITVILYASFPEVMEIDHVRNVKLQDKEEGTDIEMQRRRARG